MATLLPHRLSRGVTLVEVVVVLAILAVLATFITPRLGTSVAFAKETESSHDKAMINSLIYTIEASGGTVGPGATYDVDTTSVETVLSSLSSGVVLDVNFYVLLKQPQNTDGWAIGDNRVL